MAKTQTYTTLLDRAETPLQTHILLAQLAILRKQDRLRNQRGVASGEALLTLLVGLAVIGLGLFLFGYVATHPEALFGLPAIQ